ncbi:hypothetical protein [Streptomyces albipurpureus]|uniref:Uncharacterized protein n=1 Tax=Streptomyces albipurpureus TaxID=2897419 RepID=A0ABT0UVP9_9ACTN|nr:hypothetical protein [Streptomyces sp. CWNU-1]MCM2392180.1 hypothetical protein [Streptomyces sp. CWNU-1]
MLDVGMETNAGGGVRKPATPATTAAAPCVTTAYPTPCGAPPAPAGSPRHGCAASPDQLGTPCDLVTVPARQGLEAVDILRRTAAPAVGPVLHDGACDTLGFLVPPGTADGWDLPGSSCTRTSGRGPRIPRELPVRGTGWLLPPGDADEVTDPEALREALDEAARLIEAADSCR